MEGDQITDEHTARVVQEIIEGLDQLRASGLDRLSDDDVSALLIGLEGVGRRVRALQVEVLGEAERRGLHNHDGHSTARVMIRHRARLSSGEATHRSRLIRALRDLPVLAAAYQHGQIGHDQINLIARVHANPRIGRQPQALAALIGFQDDLVTMANRYSYREFEQALARWENLIDTNGPEPANSTTHHNRDASLTQDPFDLTWRLKGRFAALQGSRLRDIFNHFINLERERDWTEARARLGDTATTADLARTDTQRRADALEHIFTRAATTPTGATTPPPVVHNIVWSADTYFATLHRLDCDNPACGSMTHSDPNPWYDPATYRCETLDGTPLEPIETAIDSLHHQVQRIIINTRGVVIDMGRATRLFTGNARKAVKLHHTTCIWPGCHVPTTACEADHLHPHAQGGPTNPNNGAPLCGRHNRWKQKGFTTYRDQTGHWHTIRPDGREVA